jgi:hypothetical protein
MFGLHKTGISRGPNATTACEVQHGVCGFPTLNPQGVSRGRLEAILSDKERRPYYEHRIAA